MAFYFIAEDGTCIAAVDKQELVEVTQKDFPGLKMVEIDGDLVDIANKKIVDGEFVSIGQEIEEVRARRNALLLECDWTQLPDSPLSEGVKLEWQTYRQALRDITEDFSQDVELQWPTAPKKLTTE